LGEKNIHPHVILDQIEACKVELNRTHKNKESVKIQLVLVLWVMLQERTEKTWRMLPPVGLQSLKMSGSLQTGPNPPSVSYQLKEA